MSEAIELITQLSIAERSLMRRHGVRLRVDKIAADGHSALCSVRQVRRSFFRSPRSTEELVSLAHAALTPLYLLGLQAFISILTREHDRPFGALDRTDPFHLLSAFRDARREDPLLASAQLRSDRRSKR